MPRPKSKKGRAAQPATRPQTTPETHRIRSPVLFPSAKAGNFRDAELSLDVLHAGKIYAIKNFLSEAECDAWVSHGERLGFEEAYHPATYESAHRDNGRIELISDSVAERIWERLQRFIPAHMGRGVGCYNKIRLYRYCPGQRFGRHIDESHELDTRGRHTGVTVLIYLNEDGLRGGETVFYANHVANRPAVCFRPQKGSLLFHGCVVRARS